MSKRKRSPIVASGTVQAGKVHFDNAKLVTAALNAWHAERITVTIAQETETRRQKQNRYYWSVVVKMIAEDTGQPADDVHLFLKGTFLKKQIELHNHMTGESQQAEAVLSSARLTVQEFCDFVDESKLWAAEFLGIVIPDADPDYWRRDDREAA